MLKLGFEPMTSNMKSTTCYHLTECNHMDLMCFNVCTRIKCASHVLVVIKLSSLYILYYQLAELFLLQVHKDLKQPFLMSGCKVADGYGTMLVNFYAITFYCAASCAITA